ncbi:MAG: endonuclease V [bacterium]
MEITQNLILSLKKEQLNLSKRLNLIPLDKNIKDFKIIVGIDLTFTKEENKERGIVCFAILKNNINNIKVEYKYLKDDINFSYIPGFLAFRELPLIEKLFYILKEEYKKEIEAKEVIFFIDGHGISHPRSLGIASHFGVKLNQISIGIAKKKLFGYYNPNELNQIKLTKLYTNEKKEKQIGYVINTELISKRRILGSKILFISPGNNIDCESSLKIFLDMVKNYNLVITELAHKYLLNLRKNKI